MRELEVGRTVFDGLVTTDPCFVGAKALAKGRRLNRKKDRIVSLFVLLFFYYYLLNFTIWRDSLEILYGKIVVPCNTRKSNEFDNDSFLVLLRLRKYKRSLPADDDDVESVV